MKFVITLLLCSFLQVNMESEIMDLFNKFQKTYHRKYHSAAERNKAYANFKKNFKKVAKLNEDSDKDFEKTGIHKYHLNRYADQDPNEIQERYGITISPYYFSSDEHDYLRKYEENIKRLPIESMNLYNLEDTEKIYENFKKEYKKKNHTTPFTQAIHYQRFYKTLIELNNKKFNGDDEAFIESDADVIKNPHEYFFEYK